MPGLRHRDVQDIREKIRRQVQIEAKRLALRVVDLAKQKKAQKPLVLDMRNLSGFCDYFVIAGATSLRQVAAIADAIQEDLEKEGLRALSKALPNDESGWVVLDYGAVVAHIFTKPMREFYALERLWADAKRVRVTKPK